MANRITVVISAGRGSDPTARALEEKLASALKDRPDVEVGVIPHLYDLPPDGSTVEYLRSVAGDVVVLSWLYPRATFWLLDAAGVPGHMGSSEPARSGAEADRTIWCFDLREHDDAEVLIERIERLAAQSTGDAAAVGPARMEPIARMRWYPVVDYDRCQNCLECMNFCLFGVFGLDQSDRLLVEQPDACRDGCPACARVCPAQAIIFPYNSSPAIAGDPKTSSDGLGAGLVQLLGTLNPQQLAASERDRALVEKAEADQPSAGDDLDRLVDDLDGIEL